MRFFNKSFLTNKKIKKIPLQLIKAVKSRPIFTFYLIVGLLVRFLNFSNNLYFTWDQGRDAWKLAQMAQGDITLLGPTSGLPGFFLGPLWYYAGLPGYFLSQGNPWGIAVWYVVLASLSLPLFWHLAHLLFPGRQQKKWALLTAFALSLLPGSIHGSVFIWNPLLSLPLVSLAAIGLVLARKSRFWLLAAGLAWFLTLQAEFAYAVFFLVLFWGGIFYWRGRRDWPAFWLSGGLLAMTLLPQLVFEIKNDWLLSRSLWSGLFDQSRLVSWLDLFSRRPRQLIWASGELFFRGLPTGESLFLLLLPFFAWSIYHAFTHRQYRWRMMAIFAVWPYLCYLFWRGNYGNFFDYYLTSHFIFLLPLLVYAFQNPPRFLRIRFGERFFFGLIIGILLLAGANYLSARWRFDDNRAGLKTMERALATLYSWRQRDGLDNQGTFLIFTPNRQTEHYDYVMHFLAKKKQMPVPLTYKKNRHLPVWYVLIEPDRQIPEKRFLPWYQKAAENGMRIRSIKIGDLVVEAWLNQTLAQEKGYLPVASAIDFLSKPYFPGQATEVEARKQLVE